MKIRFLSTLLLVALILCPFSSLLAQQVPLADFEQGPYAGPVEEAIVGLEVATAASGVATTVRRGYGIVLRCDGFLLAPAGLFELLATGKGEPAAQQTVTVVLNPGADRQRRLSGLPAPRFFARGIGYVAFKLRAVHLLALRTLLPDALKPGDAVQVVWRRWDDATHTFGPIERRDARIAERAATPDSHGEMPAMADDRTGFVRFATPLDGVPPGAVVIGPDGMAVGLVDGNGAPAPSAGFVSFAVLNHVTNCVTPVPTTDAVYRQLQQAAPDDQKMRPVPGGPVQLPKAVLAEQRDMQGEATACVAPFEVDPSEVTNAQYLAFWQSLPEEERSNPRVRAAFYPLSWADGDSPFPADIAAYPVLGVPLAGAHAYARAHGKRLPTPYEWCRAALGPNGEAAPPDWAKRYLADRLATWQRVCERHAEYAQDHAEILLRDSVDPQARVPVTPTISTEIPWIVHHAPAMEASSFSKVTVEVETAKLWETWRAPNTLQPAGSRAFDVSPYGAKDMILNAAEMVVPSPAPPAAEAMRYLYVDWRIQRPAPNPQAPWTLVNPGGFWPPLDAESLWTRNLASLDRLIRHTLDERFRGGYILANIVLLLSHLYEQIALLAPLDGWQVRVGSETGATFTISPTMLEGINRFLATGAGSYTYQLEGYGVWRGEPRHFLHETGHAPSFHSEDMPFPDRSDRDFLPAESILFTYLAPVGFRCVR